MSESSDLRITDRWILSRRGKKNNVDMHRPYAWLVEEELSASGEVEHTGVIFLTNRECPFNCLMCDLWKNTTDVSVAPGAIPEQIEWALERMPGIKQIKLYNSGSFFDTGAIREDEYSKIASLLDSMKTVIVESSPAFINDRCLAFREMLKPDLEVAIGLETVNRDILKKLNKKMSAEDFRNAAEYLKKNGINTRAFILLRPPFMNESEGVIWAKKSIEFAFRAGSECCIVIPVRRGNGAMDILEENGLFSPPRIRSLEEVLEHGINLNSGRVFADTWDLDRFIECIKCDVMRIKRLEEMNLTRKIPAPVICSCN